MSSTYSDDFKDAFAKVVDAKEEQQAIMEFLEEEHPDEMRRLRELKGEIPDLQDQMKDRIREHGSSGEYLDYKFTVQPKTRTVIDSGDLLERAQERGEVEQLVELGFLKYAVVANQLDRLPGTMKAVYTRFINKEKATSAVTIPKGLKG